MPDYLDTVEQQLVALTEKGRHRRRRPRGDAVVLAVALAVVVAVVAIAARGGSTPHHGLAGRHSVVQRGSQQTQHPIRKHAVHRRSSTPSATTGAAPPAGGPVPAGFGPQSFTAISEFTWWLLGTAPCSSPPCTSIVRTTDGGQTFVGIPAPRTTAVTQLRFADALNGFAYGPQLWVTHDGGASWHRVGLGGSLVDLAASDGWVYAIVQAKGHGSLERSPVGVDQWASLPAASDAFSGLWARGPDVLVQSGQARAGDALMVSHDRGASFIAEQLPPSIECDFEAPAPPVVWEHCATGMLSSTWRSRDYGRSFTPAAKAPVRGPTLPNSAAFAAASASTAVEGYRKLYRTTDGGRTWAPVPGPTGITWWQYLGFTDATHGVALGFAGAEVPSNERLYYTTDGGASYHLVTIG